MSEPTEETGRGQRGTSWPPDSNGLRIAIATVPERQEIFRVRHEVYATELGQHPENQAAMLSDPLDDVNEYICASMGGEVVGFVSITPPGHDRYSIDKYLGRNELPFTVDDGLFEIRLLTVRRPFRGTPIAGILMYAALRWVEERRGTRIVLIGRNELVDVYQRAGMELLGRQVTSGAVTFELMGATVAAARERANHYLPALRRLTPLIDWQLGMPMERQTNKRVVAVLAQELAKSAQPEGGR
jgi:GNAT superfamily N-acetyltransferase